MAMEQNLLETHDVVVFQHPMFWYFTPAILRDDRVDLDAVRKHGWQTLEHTGEDDDAR